MSNSLHSVIAKRLMDQATSPIGWLSDAKVYDVDHENFQIHLNGWVDVHHLASEVIDLIEARS